MTGIKKGKTIKKLSLVAILLAVLATAALLPSSAMGQRVIFVRPHHRHAFAVYRYRSDPYYRRPYAYYEPRPYVVYRPYYRRYYYSPYYSGYYGDGRYWRRHHRRDARFSLFVRR